ncbi:MAG TPA: PaaI family thioesterase, partial [Acidimicrobiia bacterium]|nr:PaaI family thioesterase [Acidimicrobiia bacterium]
AIKAPTPLHVPVTYEASLRAVDGRKLHVDATLSTAEGVLTATADAVFLAVDMEKVASTKRAAEAWA